jgi:uncharacterized protein DUF481
MTSIHAVKRRAFFPGRLAFLLWLAVGAALPVMPARGDVLIGVNGERFVGKVIEETADTVVFQSDLGGRFTIPRSRVREIQRTAAETSKTPANPLLATNAPVSQSSTNLDWRPPGVGHDGADWVQLKSGEWLRGEFRYLQDKKIEFDSDELDDLTLKLKDVRKLYTAHRMLTQFDRDDPIFGRVSISNEMVLVTGADTVAQSRERLTGITPGGQRELRYWSGKATLGLSFQSGNNDVTTMNTAAHLARRTPNTKLLLDYLGNFSEVNGVESANNQRANLTYDIRLGHKWFVRPLMFEYYHDPLANIDMRLTGGFGGGYYIFDTDTLEWTVSAGPGYQYTEFETIAPGDDATISTPAAVLQSKFKFDITRRLTIIQTYQGTFTEADAGRYSQHFVTTLEFEIKRHLNLDVSFIWDYLDNPQIQSDLTVPEKSDYYLTVGFGVRF